MDLSFQRVYAGSQFAAKTRRGGSRSTAPTPSNLVESRCILIRVEKKTRHLALEFLSVRCPRWDKDFVRRGTKCPRPGLGLAWRCDTDPGSQLPDGSGTDVDRPRNGQDRHKGDDKTDFSETVLVRMPPARQISTESTVRAPRAPQIPHAPSSLSILGSRTVSMCVASGCTYLLPTSFQKKVWSRRGRYLSWTLILRCSFAVRKGTRHVALGPPILLGQWRAGPRW